MDPAKLSMTTTQVTVKEAGKSVEVTETAILTNVDGTLAEANNQLGLSMSDKMEIDYLATLGTTALTFDGTATTSTNVIDAIDLFNDEDAGEYILFINPADYTALYKEMVVGNTFLGQEQLAELLGLSAIVKTKRVAAGTSYIQKQGAVEIVYKKRPEIKADDDILARTVVIAGNTFYATNLYNEGGVVKLEAVE